MKSTKLGSVQLRIMRVLWDRQRATAREITETLNRRRPNAHSPIAHSPIAHSTVQTLLRTLEDKGAVGHEAEGRTFVFFSLVPEDKVKRTATRDLVQRVFGGRPTELVAHLLETEKLSADELAEIQRLVNRHKSSGKRST